MIEICVGLCYDTFVCTGMKKEKKGETKWYEAVKYEKIW